jgi:hypothetical protein
MDWRTFTVELVKALAWPITVWAVTIAAWKHVTRLLPRLREVRVRDVQFSFVELLREASQDAEAALPSAASLPSLPSSESDRITQLLALSPRAAVLEAFVPVQTALTTLARSHGIHVGRADHYSASALADKLTAAGLLSEGQRTLFGSLRQLRNAAAHAPEFREPPESVREYIDLAGRLAAAIRLQAT